MTWNHDRFMAADFETSGTLPEYALQPWRVKQGKAWATSLSYVKFVGNTLKPHGGLAPDVEMMRAMLELAIAEKRTIIGWNIVFDIAWLIAYGLEDLVFQVKWLDGMLLWRHWFIEPEYEVTRANKVSYALKPGAIDEFLPTHAGYQDDVDFHSTDPAELKKLQKYNDRDTLATYIITMMLYERLEEDPRRLRAALIEADSLPMIAQANLEGMLVDTLATRELEAHLSATADKMLEALEPHGITEKVVRSPLQLAKVMYDEWKLPVLKENVSKLTGKVSRSTDKEVLHELAFEDPRARQVKEYREALGNRAKFADAVLASVDYNEDGRTHPQARVFGTYTSRLTYASKQGKNKDERQTGFALHQEKRGKEFRDILIAPPGYTLVEFDFAGQEFRWMAIAARDPVMLKLCEPGEDAHSYMASRIYERDYKEFMAAVEAKVEGFSDMRQLGKVGNLSLQFRTSARKLRSVARVQYSIPMEMPQAYFIHSTYRKSYNRVPAYWKEQIDLTKSKGYVETLAGRRVQVVGDWEGSFGWSMGSTAINYRIQGTGGDQKYLAMAILRNYIRSVGAYFAWDLHDGLYWWVPDKMVDRFAREGKYLLDNLPYQKAWGLTPPIGLPVDCKTGGSWGSLKPYKFD